MLSIKRLIDLARLEVGSYKEVAKILDTSNVRVTHWRNGRNEPTPFEIFKMAEIARLEPIDAFLEVMADMDKENEKYWCARRESNPRPSASESVSIVKYICNIVLIILNNHHRNHLFALAKIQQVHHLR